MKDLPVRIHIIKAKYRSTDEFRENVRDGGVLFVATREPLPVGEAVVVEVRFPGLQDEVLLRGTVAFRQSARHSQKVRAGVGVTLAAAERAKLTFLEAQARGEDVGPVSARRHRRLPIELGVSWRVKEERFQHHAMIDDIGAGGACLFGTDIPPAGSALVMEVVPPGSVAPLALEGRVAWSRPGADRPGFGVEFRCRDTGGLRLLKELVRRLQIEA